MRSKGVYYIPSSDKVIAISRVEYFPKEITPTPCSLVTWVDDKGKFPKTMIRENQFKQFVRIGEL